MLLVCHVNKGEIIKEMPVKGSCYSIIKRMAEVIPDNKVKELMLRHDKHGVIARVVALDDGTVEVTMPIKSCLVLLKRA